MKTQQHIIFKIIALTLMLAVLLPSAVKFTHVLENHEHEVCIDYSSTHLHEIDLECEFYKFKLNNSYSLVFNTIKFVKHSYDTNIISSQYQFIDNHKQTGIKQRGPPRSKSFTS